MSADIIDFRERVIERCLTLRSEMDQLLDRVDTLNEQGYNKAAQCVLEKVKQTRSIMTLYKRKLRDLKKHNVVSSPKLPPTEKKSFKQYSSFYSGVNHAPEVQIQSDQ